MSNIPAVKYEYQVAQAQYSRITFINGCWNGQRPPQEDNAISSCQYVWDYLNKMGEEGWQLASALNMDNNAQVLYLVCDKNNHT